MPNLDISLENKDVLDAFYREYETTDLVSKLQQKYEIQPYYKRNRGAKRLADISIWVFQLASIITASIFLYNLMHTNIGVFWLSATITGILLVLLEVAKRLCLPAVFKNWYQFKRIRSRLLAFAFILSGISIFLSFKGTPYVVSYAMGEYEEMTADSSHYQAKIQEINADIARWSKQTWRGVIVQDARAAIAGLNHDRRMLEENFQKQVDEVKASNDENKGNHNKKKNDYGGNLAILAIIFESMFICGVWFRENYDYRSHKEMVIIKEIMSDGNSFADALKILAEAEDIAKNGVKPTTEQGNGEDLSSYKRPASPPTPPPDETPTSKNSLDIEVEIIDTNQKKNLGSMVPRILVKTSRGESSLTKAEIKNRMSKPRANKEFWQKQLDRYEAVHGTT